MKKFSEITEGLWNGIVRRGTTGENRMEDGVSNLDKNSFYEYLKSNYSDKVEHMDIDVSYIAIDITSRIILMEMYSKGEFKAIRLAGVKHINKDIKMRDKEYWLNYFRNCLYSLFHI